MIRLGLRLTLRKRSRSGAARPRHRGSRRPRRRSAAGRPGRCQRAARPDRPWCVARHLGAGVPVDVGSVDIRPAVVAVEHRPVRQPGDRPRRRCRRRTERSRSRRGFRICRDRASTTPRRPSRRSSRPNRRTSSRPVSGAPDRDHRRSGTAVPELADHRHRPHRTPALAGTWCGRGRSHPAHAGQLLRLPEHHRERTRSAVHSGRRSRRALAARADLDRDREPAVGRAARGALRRDAARRRHAASDLGGLRGGGSGRGGRGRRSRLRTLLRLPTAALPRAVHRSAPRPRRPLAALDRHRARRDRRPGRRGRVRAPRASQGPDIAARREAASVVPPTADRADHPAPRRHRRARVLRRGRQAGQQRRPASRAARGLRAPCRGAGSRWTVVHDRGFSTHGEAGQSPRHAHRRSPAPRQSQGGLPVHQWARDRPLRHERSDRGAQLHRRRQQLRRRKRRERHPRRPVLQLLDVELSRFRPSSFRPRPGACRAPHDARSAQL